MLGASRNALHSLHGVDFARLPQIRALHLSGNALREVPVSLRAAAGSLRVLDLSHNALARLPHWLATRVAREADMPLLGAFAAHGNPCATPDDSEGTASRGPAPARSQAGPSPVVAPSGAGAGAGGRGEGSRAGEGERADETRFAARTCGGEVPTDLDATLATLSRIQRGLEALGGAGRI